MILPWHQDRWQNLTARTRSLHHGLLISANPGTGLREFVTELSHYLICEMAYSNQRSPCLSCQNCKLFEAGSHPDFHVITSENESANGRIELLSAYSERYLDVKQRDRKAKPGKVVSVNQIRQLIDRFTTHCHISATKIGLIIPADRMNINAANALLKLLEEPPENTILILAASEPARLPRTILSRCVNVKLSEPAVEQSVSWLSDYMPENQARIAIHLSGQSPIQAKQLYEFGELEARESYLKSLISTVANQSNPLDVAQQLAKMEFETTLLWMQQFIKDLTVWCTTQQKPFWKIPEALSIRQVSENRLFALYDRITHYKKIARGSINEQLALEDLLIALTRVSR